jgi:hypothetical protein
MHRVDHSIGMYCPRDWQSEGVQQNALEATTESLIPLFNMFHRLRWRHLVHSSLPSLAGRLKSDSLLPPRRREPSGG